jgi:TonB-dependent starch-binding outer membrane protein SusC
MKVKKILSSGKLLTLMKIGFAQSMIAFVICGVTMAHDNLAQMLDQKVSIDANNVPFEQVLNALTDQTGVKFAYGDDQIDLNEPISVKAEKRALKLVLDELLAPLNIQYKLHEREATVALKKQEPELNDPPASPRSLRHESKPKPLIQISGRVTTGEGEPMAGVNVIVKGTTNGTSTDSDGRYAINAETGEVLIFSFIGYAPQEIMISSRPVIDVTMQEDVTSLRDVVVNAGYWKVRDQERTGNISRVTAEEIQKQPVNNPLQALQGRMAGVYIQQNTGMPGGGIKIQIRGQNSLRTGGANTVNGNLPLYIVDGIPFTSSSMTSAYTSNSNLQGGNPLSAINPSDIESIEILKDADATAIYGSRGANGVVLITTKRAAAGKTKFTLDVYQGVGQVERQMKLLNSEQYMDMRMEALKNDGYLPFLENPAYNFFWPDLKVWDTTRYTDWQEKLIGGTANTTNAQGTISGGNANTQFLLGGGFYRETTVFPGDNDFLRGSGRLNLNHSSENKKFNAMASLNYTSSVSDIPTLDFTARAVTLAPVAPALYNNDGSLNWEDGTWQNPLANLERKYRNNIDNLIANTTLSYELIAGLTAKTNLGYTSLHVTESTINPLSAYNPDQLNGLTGSSVFANREQKTWIAEPQLSYLRKISAGDFNVLVGTTFQQSRESGQVIEATGYTNDALLENINAATATNVVASSYMKYRYAAAFMRINYNWDGKYIVNLTGRRDGSSRFGVGNRFANFGAIGTAWIFSNENFFTDRARILSFGKLRFSHGTTGSDAIGNYQYLDTYTPTTYPYNGVGGLVTSRLNNPDYSWESNRKTEFGLDLGFAKDRIVLSAVHYINRSSNQLVGLPLPVMTGQSFVQFNLPAEVENSGWEFQVISTNISTNKFEWKTNANLTIPRNKLLSFPDIDKFPAYGSALEIGKSLYIFKALQYSGVDPQTGVYVFADSDGDGIISPVADIVALRESTQQYFGGINNAFRYGAFSVDVFLQFVKQTGRDFRHSFNWPGSASNQPVEVMERWREPGDAANVQKFSAFEGKAINAYFLSTFSDNLIVDASFVRVKNVSLSWQLPSNWVSKIAAERASIYLQGQNLLTFTKYRGMDPETMSSVTLPPLRVITAGFQLTF